ncbi:hypothetical protein JANAI62_03870 [Jannaschia pagri]|uniref:Uncharacterized protein n=1 Tax=Jannaschia pagri TaxID=2829797 RepID=A0ABQ4NHT9_9RHOB|nr:MULTISPECIES: hypothetical protein [unclassified Jannaschia]GIT90130.1 hypothetical protein JANAI61_05880 [Jannaschia sp. AI_61]GIT93764.1 hypothetical protein JANAI62_03870 [Jannaschia sp. AI_62]
MSDDTHEDLNVDHDNLVSHMDAWARGESKSASEAAERRGEIRQFLDDNPGLHKKALSDIRRIDKMDDEKRADYLRSFDHLRDLLQGQWEGQSTPDMFEDGPKATEADEVQPFDGDEALAPDEIAV